MENHDQAFYVWRDAGVRQRTLVHIDAHPDMWWFDKGPRTIGNFICTPLRQDLGDGLILRLKHETAGSAGEGLGAAGPALEGVGAAGPALEGLGAAGPALEGMNRLRAAAEAEWGGQPEPAESNYRMAMRLLPDSAAPPYQLARILVRSGRLEEGRELYRRAVELDHSYQGPFSSTGFHCLARREFAH